MNMHADSPRLSRLLPWALLLLCLGGLCVAPGCRRGAGGGEFDDLTISSRRFNIDEDRGLVRIYGRLDNPGTGHFHRVEVHAILRSAGGDKRGENSVLLENVKPADKRTFALVVTSHGRVSDVELEVRNPVSP